MGRRAGRKQGGLWASAPGLADRAAPLGGKLPLGLPGECAPSRPAWALQTPVVFLIRVGRGGLLHWVLSAE